jgi:DNA polymerase-3 subunit alpha
MAFVTLEDFRGSTETLCFAEPYEHNRSLLQVDAILGLAGRTSVREGSDPKLLVDRALPLDRLCAELVLEVAVGLPPDLGAELVGKLLALIRAHPGDCPLRLLVRAPEGFETRVAARRASVRPTPDFLLQLGELLGQEAVSIRCRPAQALLRGVEGRSGGRRAAAGTGASG